MKLRHTAAFALVGWYLIIPPRSLNGVDATAPIGNWVVYKEYKEYDSVAGCFAARRELRLRAAGDPNRNPPLEFPAKQLEQFSAADCVESDDPRLKEPPK